MCWSVEKGEAVNYVRDTITVASGTVASGIGQILGKITVSGKYTQVAPAAGDGSQNAAAVLLESFSATLGADTQFEAVTRGPAVFKDAGLLYTSGMTAPQKATAQGQLVALGMKIESAA